MKAKGAELVACEHPIGEVLEHLFDEIELPVASHVVRLLLGDA